MSDKSIIGLSRLVTLRQQVDTVARNIANQSTTGYKSEGLRFREYLTEAKKKTSDRHRCGRSSPPRCSRISQLGRFRRPAIPPTLR
jgi:flagellar basal body rod protein FlgG